MPAWRLPHCSIFSSCLRLRCVMGSLRRRKALRNFWADDGPKVTQNGQTFRRQGPGTTKQSTALQRQKSKAPAQMAAATQATTTAHADQKQRLRQPHTAQAPAQSTVKQRQRRPPNWRPLRETRRQNPKDQIESKTPVEKRPQNSRATMAATKTKADQPKKEQGGAPQRQRLTG
jgi:lipopolysaccharide export LptBFGC system permease protein LptF